MRVQKYTVIYFTIVLCIIIISVLQQRSIVSNLNAFNYSTSEINNFKLSSKSILSIGDNVILEASFLANTKEIASKVSSFAVKKDIQSIIYLVYDGKVFAVDDGTNAIITDSSFSLYEVRIATGSQTGKRGWLPKEFVK